MLLSGEPSSQASPDNEPVKLSDKQTPENRAESRGLGTY